jgi:protein disulfide-isomerase A6
VDSSLTSYAPPHLPQTPQLTFLSLQAGRIPSLDALASTFLGPTSSRSSILAQAAETVSTLAGDSSSALASYYVKIMTKFSESAEGANEWIEKESARLGRIAGGKGKVGGKKLDELRMKQNVSSLALTYENGTDEM